MATSEMKMPKGPFVAEEIQKILLDDIYPLQERIVEDEEEFQQLKKTIEIHGQQQAGIARWKEKDGKHYQLLDGVRRWRALLKIREEGKIARQTMELKVIICTDEEAHDTWNISNIRKSLLHPLDLAKNWGEQQKLFGRTQEEIARRYGHKQQKVSDILSLNRVTEKIQQLFKDGVISLSHNVEIARLPMESQESVAQEAINEKWTTKQLENKVNSILTSPTPTVNRTQQKPASAELVLPSTQPEELIMPTTEEMITTLKARLPRNCNGDCLNCAINRCLHKDTVKAIEKLKTNVGTQELL